MLSECEEILSPGIDFGMAAPTTTDINQLLEAALSRFTELF